MARAPVKRWRTRKALTCLFAGVAERRGTPGRLPQLAGRVYQAIRNIKYGFFSPFPIKNLIIIRSQTCIFDLQLTGVGIGQGSIKHVSSVWSKIPGQENYKSSRMF